MTTQPFPGKGPDMALPALETDSDPTPFRAGIRCPQCATLPICFIGSLTEASHNRLAPCVAEHAFRKGQLLQPEGCVAQQLSVVKLGTVALRRQGKSGQPQPLAMLGRGQALGGYAIYGHAEPISAVALSAGRICRVEVADLYRLGLVDRRFHASMQQHIVRSHGHLADWARVMHIKNIRQRVLATLQLYAREQRVSVIRLPGHVALSTLLSTTRETVARSLQQLEASGHIVRHDRWHCEVIPPRQVDAKSPRDQRAERRIPPVVAPDKRISSAVKPHQPGDSAPRRTSAPARNAPRADR